MTTRWMPPGREDFQLSLVLDGDIDDSEAGPAGTLPEGKLNLTKIVFEENRGPAWL